VSHPGFPSSKVSYQSCAAEGIMNVQVVSCNVPILDAEPNVTITGGSSATHSINITLDVAGCVCRYLLRRNAAGEGPLQDAGFVAATTSTKLSSLRCYSLEITDVKISGLEPNTTYNIELTVSNMAGGTTRSVSFQTLPLAPAGTFFHLHLLKVMQHLPAPRPPSSLILNYSAATSLIISWSGEDTTANVTGIVLLIGCSSIS
jgi:hypothetical protein